MIVGLDAPSPNTVCVAVFHRGQALHALAASLSAGRVPREGTRPAAVIVTAPASLLDWRNPGFIHINSRRETTSSPKSSRGLSLTGRQGLSGLYPALRVRETRQISTPDLL